MKRILISTIFAIITLFAFSQKGFISVKNKQFIKAGKPYHYIGTNYWYGGILASKSYAGDRNRLIKELDLMKSVGITNLRVLVGAEGPDNESFRVSPTLQTSQGVYNDTLFDGLDFLINEMSKRGMYAILYLNNTWDWSGGYSQYLNWNGYGKIPNPNVKGNTWPMFMDYIKQFLQCEECKKQSKRHVETVLKRINRYTNISYVNDPTIMAWEVANEPRALTMDNAEALKIWVKEIADLIKSIDKNHLVTTGSEGIWGSENNAELFTDLHKIKSIDYLTIHIWPKNWGWLDIKNIPQSVDKSIENTKQYINQHIAIAKTLQKPLVIEEFGLPRDNHKYQKTDKTTARDKYYSFIFGQVLESAKNKGVIAGCNFWAFGGIVDGKPDSEPFWHKGNALLGDPPQEEQGLNSVFGDDSTMEIIKEFNELININH